MRQVYFIQLNQARFQRVECSLRAARQVELGEDVAHVRLDRLLGDEQHIGDLAVGKPARER